MWKINFEEKSHLTECFSSYSINDVEKNSIEFYNSIRSNIGLLHV